MRRRLSAASLVLALLIAPSTVAFAEEPSLTEQTAEDEATSGPLIALVEFLTQWAEALIENREATSGDEVDGDAAETFTELVDSLETVLTDLFASLYFFAVAEDALADAEEELEASSDGVHGEAVSTVARCAPRGSFGDLVEGMAHHGAYIRAAAHGEVVALIVPTIEVDEATGAPSVITDSGEPVEFDLSAVEGAEALCDALDVVYQARLLQLDVAWEDVDSARDARVLAREQCRLERLRARNDASGEASDACAELRERVRDQHREDRDARRSQREAEREAKAAERAERKADRPASKAARAGNH